MSKKQRQSSKLYKPRSFDVHKNATAPIIMILDCPELNTEVLDVGMETVESDNCRVMSRNDGDVNGVLATICEGVRFSCKDGWKFINPFT